MGAIYGSNRENGKWTKQYRGLQKQYQTLQEDDAD